MRMECAALRFLFSGIIMFIRLTPQGPTRTSTTVIQDHRQDTTSRPTSPPCSPCPVGCFTATAAVYDVFIPIYNVTAYLSRYYNFVFVFKTGTPAGHAAGMTPTDGGRNDDAPVPRPPQRCANPERITRDTDVK